MAARLGTLVGAYRLERVIGRGGMGVVYEAVHASIGQRAAVKILGGDATRRPEYVERFTREAKTACAVRHPGLVQVFDCGQLADGTPFLMMEYVEGDTLRVHLGSKARLGALESARLTRQLASALSLVHASGIVHRDVKPENVLVLEDDAAEGGRRAKLLDFGIAQVHGGGGAEARMTQEGTVLGTPAYMAPEQCLPSGEATPATDVYSLGVVFFEMLTGAPPFRGDGPNVLRAHLVTPPPLERVLAAPELMRLVKSMLAKEPGARPTAAAVAEALGRFSGPSRVVEALSPTEPNDSVLPHAVSWYPTGVRARRLRRVGARGVVGAAAIALGVVGWKVTHRKHAAIELSSMVHFAGGAVTMGRTSEERAADCAAMGEGCRRDAIDREQPVHVARVSPFHLDVDETSNFDFVGWVNSTRVVLQPDDTTHESRYVYDESGAVLLADLDPTYGHIRVMPNRTLAVVAGFERYPVVQITWDGARLYCASRGKRLPTEAERELAARGAGAGRRYPWGDDEPRCDGVVFERLEGRCANLGLPQGVQPIDSGEQDWSPERVHGLGGNASEWVEDAFVRPYYEDCGRCVDPVQLGAPDAGVELRVFRGSGWSNGALFVRSSGRARWERRSVSGSLGVRCAVSADE
jgi:formylglycine-generating enzyme required for sulfatase activity